MGNDRIVKRVYVRVCAGVTVQECLKKKGLDVRQAKRIVHDRSLWWGFEGECMGHCPGG